MKDLTPAFEHDYLLRRKERRGSVGISADEGRVNALSEEQMLKKRQRYDLCLPVACDILEESRAALAVRFRFLDRALWRMPLRPRFDLYGIASDGASLHYDPVYVVERFKLSPNEMTRDLAHCLFHCIFRHPFMLYSVLRQAWDVSCDIAIEALLLDLLGEAFPCNMDRRAKEALKLISAQVGGVITAERLYHFFSNEGNKVDLVSLRPIFYHDAHGLWYGDNQDRISEGGKEASRRITEERSGAVLPDHEGSVDLDDIRDDIAFPQGLDGGENDANVEGSHAREGGDAARDSGRPEDGVFDKDRLADEWEDVSRRMQTELETAVTVKGDGAGSLMVALKAVNRETYDYSLFLKRFATLHERMRTSPDEFDYIYYTYGLNRYGNMPLIEPLEYREDRSVRDLAVVIDTSESVSGDLVQAFVRKTYNILKQTESFNDRVNIHLIQCDARVQEDVRITSLDQLDIYLESMELKGFGGTDFRPAFEYVNLLVEKHEFSDLRGLVYFTDGKGTYPRKKPKYDVAFVFLDDGFSDPEVPPWALKVILNEREIRVIQERKQAGKELRQ